MTTQPLSPLTMLLSRHTRRREIIMLLGGAAVWPLTARGEPKPKMLRLGYVGVQSPDAPLYKAFRNRIAELGYQEGRNFSFEYIQTPDIEGYGPAYRELAAREVGVFLAVGEPGLRAARAAAGPLPIAFLAVDFDPIEKGYVASLARPDGNATGIAVQQMELAAKRIELLREVLPNARRSGLFPTRSRATKLKQRPTRRDRWALSRCWSKCPVRSPTT